MVKTKELKKKSKKLAAAALSLCLAAGMAPAAAFADDGGQSTEKMNSVSLAGVTYFYTDVNGDSEDTVYQGIIKSRKGETKYEFTKDKLTQVADTDYYYAVPDNSTPLSGILYGYGEGTATNYKEVYQKLNVSTDESYDAVSSATKYTSHHAGDIPSNVIFGTDGNGDKAITGLNLGRKTEQVDAKNYVDAGILKAAGEELSDAQNDVLDIVLKVNPMNAPSENIISAKFGSAEFTNSKYGTATINVYPDENVEGYIWSEYLDSIYAATISDGTNTAGAVYWIDLYGEKATSGYHYNKVEFELNNGLTRADNVQTVSRFAKFFDEEGSFKPGTYTVTIYAEGYDNVTGNIEVTKDDVLNANEVCAQTEVKNAKDAVKKVQDAVDKLGDEATDAEKANAYKALSEAKGALNIAQESLVKAGEKQRAALQKKLDQAEKDLQEATKEAKEANEKAEEAVKGREAAEAKVKSAEEAKAKPDSSEKADPAKTVKKTDQKMIVKARVKKIKAKELKKKDVSVKAIKVNNAFGKVTYKKISGNKKLTVNAKNGKITVRKKTKKGAYKVKVKVMASGDASYNAASKNVTVKIKVK